MSKIKSALLLMKHTICFPILPKMREANVGQQGKAWLADAIKDGLYYVIPFEQDPETFMPDWHLLAQYLVGEATYYIGYFSALQIHSLTTQPHLKELIVVSKQINLQRFW
jgi:predicted transcriptional regulator of viral defense system